MWDCLDCFQKLNATNKLGKCPVCHSQALAPALSAAPVENVDLYVRGKGGFDLVPAQAERLGLVNV